MLQKRNIGLAILFSLITCGIYALYWMYQISADTRMLVGNSDSGGPGTDLLLDIVTCGIFGFFVVYQSAKRIHQAEQDREMRTSDDALMLTILYAFAGIISFAIIQSKINAIANSYNV